MQEPIRETVASQNQNAKQDMMPQTGSLRQAQSHAVSGDSLHPKTRLIETAAALIHRQGWTATGINQILSDAGIPKGSFYYYFKSKEALGAAVLQKHHDELLQLLEATVVNQSLSPHEAIAQFFLALTGAQSRGAFRLGCPIGSFANEIANQSPCLLEEANKSLKRYENSWIELIRRGQEKGIFASSLNPIEAGRLAVVLIQGALLVMKCEGTSDALELIKNALLASLKREQEKIGDIRAQNQNYQSSQLRALAS